MGAKQLQAMAARWEQLARENPMFYIATGRRDWKPADFYASATPQVDAILGWVGPHHGREAMLEIGCGLGRMSAAFARHFARVTGVDISPSMIEHARTHNLPANVNLSVVNGDGTLDFPSSSFDFVYCGLVFQHIPDEVVIRTYLGEIARVLRPDAFAALQFDTRPENILHRTYKSLPDAILPATHRRFIRRYRRNAALVRQWLSDAGLRVCAEKHPNSARHFVIAAPPHTMATVHRNGS